MTKPTKVPYTMMEASVGVTIPPMIPNRMIRVMMMAQMASRPDLRISLKELICSRLGYFLFLEIT